MALLGAISTAELMRMKASEQFPFTYRYTSAECSRSCRNSIIGRVVAWGTEGHREAEHILTGSGGRSASVKEEFHASHQQHEGQEPPECDLSESTHAQFRTGEATDHHGTDPQRRGTRQCLHAHGLA
jgi:hypothetical protein